MPDVCGVLGPLPVAMREKTLQRGLLRIINDYNVDPVLALMAFARSGVVGWSSFDAVGWFSYDFVEAMIVNVPEWTSGGHKRGRAGEILLGVAHQRVRSTYVADYREVGMRRAYAQAA